MSAAGEQGQAPPVAGNGRLEAFSDGVFAVAITLLALDLGVDGPGHGTLAHQLADKWPAFAAYVISFFTIGVVWINHHGLLRSLRDDRDSRTLMFLNLLVLLVVVAIPFSTSTVSQYLRADGTDAHVAAALYSAIMELLGVAFSVLLVWSARSGMQRRPLQGAEARRAFLRFGLGSVGYLVAIGLAFVSAPASVGINAVLAVYYVFERTPTSE